MAWGRGRWAVSQNPKLIPFQWLVFKAALFENNCAPAFAIVQEPFCALTGVYFHNASEVYKKTWKKSCAIAWVAAGGRPTTEGLEGLRRR